MGQASRGRQFLLSILGVTVLVALACAVNPVTGKRQLSLISEEQEIAMGRQADPQIVAEYGLYDDPPLAAYVDAVGQKLAAKSDRPNLKYTFRILDSPVINAFALPGGFVYVTRGILAHMNNEAELAIVLGHEIGHVAARHSVSQQSKQALFGVGLQLGAVFSPQVARYGAALGQGLGLLFLKFSRDDENQADDLGVNYSLRAGYDAEVGAHFFEVLDRQSRDSGSTLPDWLSTHPAPAGRIEHTHTLAVERAPQYPDAERVAAADLKGKLDGIVFGEDPREGFLSGDTFMHPGLEFQLTLPHGWKVQNTASALLAAEPQKAAGLQMTLEKRDGLSPEAYAAKLAAQAKADIDAGAAERIDGAEAYLMTMRLVQDEQTLGVLVGIIARPNEPSLFQIVGFTSAARFGTYRPDFLRTIRSFQALRDPAALRIEPNRVQVETVPRATTLEHEVERTGTVPVPIGTVALLNNLQPGSSLAPGFQLKLVRGAYRPPGS